jgi:ligand-binding sensor domain-containing protein/DNA-binding CsgD family transcriptional regulator
MSKILVLVILIFLPAATIKSFSQQDINSIRFQHITQKEGLSHNSIECIFKDSDGFIWFGTRNGLCRYDGYEIVIYRSSNKTNSLSGDRILCINEDKKGFLWIGTFHNGLNKFDKKNESFTHYDAHHFGFGDRINEIVVLKDSSLWLCTDYGLAVYNEKSDSFKVYTPVQGSNNSIANNSSFDIIETRTGETYVTTDANYIQRFDRKNGIFTTVNYSRISSMTNNFRKRIIEDSEGTLWISANYHGLCWYKPKTGETGIYTKAPGQLTSNILMGLTLDQEGQIWICTDGGGIDILDPVTRKFSYLRMNDNDPTSISSDHIYTIFFDDQQIVWVGTYDRGISYFDPSRYKFHSFLFKKNDLDFFNDKSVLSIYQDSEDRIWIGTDGFGLFMFDKDGKLSGFRYDPNNSNSISTDVITSLSEDNEGQILIGTYSGGLISFNVEKNRFTRYMPSTENINSIHSSNVWRILHDSKKRIWLGMLTTGLEMYDQENNIFISYGPLSDNPNKIDFQNIMTILEDSDGDIWFGTEGKGLYTLDNETDKMLQFATGNNPDIMTSGIIKTIYQDRRGYIWFGTEGNGLYQFNKKNNELKVFNNSDGLPSDIVQSIIEDSQGNLWIGTSRGLSKYNRNTGNFNSFIEEDGLSGNEYNKDAVLRLHDGRLIFGNTTGLDVFKPEDIPMNQILPRLNFTKLEILNQEIKPGVKFNGRIILTKSISYTSSITLTNKDKIFSLQFAAINYTLPNKCNYKYKLDGFDDTWTTISSDRRMVSYSNLDPGKYTFRIKASNNDGKWGNNDKTLQIIVLPPIWKTWWFRSLILIILILFIRFIYQYRLNLHKEQFRQLHFEREQKIIQLENEKLENELQKLTFHVINRNKVLLEYKNRLLGLSYKAREVVKIGLDDIISKIDEEISEDKEWIYIEPQLDKVYNNFVARLKTKHPDLTLSEIKIASYVRMNLSTKEISEYMHKTPRAVENDRYRLRKKIGLDLNDSLQQYLANL